MGIITDKYLKTKDQEKKVPEIPEAVLSNDRQIKVTKKIDNLFRLFDNIPYFYFA